MVSRGDVAGIAKIVGATVEAGLEVVPRDRIELSTPAFSGLQESKQDQQDTKKTECKK